jgi:hypothetical protein
MVVRREAFFSPRVVRWATRTAMVTAGRSWPAMPDDKTPRMDDPARDAHVPLPGIQTAQDMQAADEHFVSSDADLESNELHASGRVCARCGQAIQPGEDVRRTASGSYQHELCSLP